MKELANLALEGKRVFLRGDIDVPIENGVIQDTERLKLLSPTISYLLERNSRVLLVGHIGRPKNNQDFSLSTKTLLTMLSSLLNINVVHFHRIEGVEVPPLTLGLLENLRFWPEEEKNDPTFAKQLANLADVYVNEAFADCHREHASIVGVPRFLPHAAGLRLEKEVEVLSRVLANPKRPQVVIIGGVKLETKIPVIGNLAKTADLVLVGGLIASEAQEKNIEVTNNVILAKLTPDKKDIDEESVKKFCEKIETAAQIIWNGPMGVFEKPESETGTTEIARTIAKSPAEKIVGGGQTIQALKKYQILGKMDWVSSGGGAMLEFLSGKTLPGIEVLES